MKSEKKDFLSYSIEAFKISLMVWIFNVWIEIKSVLDDINTKIDTIIVTDTNITIK